jgi:predicted DNA-binding transcriptional regulator
MIKKELEKLSNDEKLIIIYWRIIEYPRQLRVDEIAKRLKYPPEYVLNSIKKFNHNIRLKLEMESIRSDLKELRGFIYWEQRNS